jgi:hypothetical protein
MSGWACGKDSGDKECLQILIQEHLERTCRRLGRRFNYNILERWIVRLGRENVTNDSVQWHDMGLVELNFWVLPPQYYFNL